MNKETYVVHLLGKYKRQIARNEQASGEAGQSNRFRPRLLDRTGGGGARLQNQSLGNVLPQDVFAAQYHIRVKETCRGQGDQC